MSGTGAGTGLEKMAGCPANRNRNRIFGTSLNYTDGWDFAIICAFLYSIVNRQYRASLDAARQDTGQLASGQG